MRTHKEEAWGLLVYVVQDDVKINSTNFYRATLCTVFVIVILSVYLSVTLVDCVHMVRPTITVSSPYGSPIILVSGDIKFIPKFKGDYPERGR